MPEPAEKGSESLVISPLVPFATCKLDHRTRLMERQLACQLHCTESGEVVTRGLLAEFVKLYFRHLRMC